MYILVTRPEDESEALCKKLSHIGLKPLSAPLMKITNIPNIEDSLKSSLKIKVQAIILTSSNAVRYLSNIIDNIKNLKTIAVGNKTAATAKQYGFTDVINVNGNALKLTDYIIENYEPKQGSILYLSAQEIAYDIEKRLSDVGFQIKRIAVYRAVKMDKFSDEIINNFNTKTIGSVLLFSKRTAEIFVNLIEKYNLKNTVNEVVAFVLSSNIASEVRKLDLKDIIVAPQPNEEALLESIKEYYGR
jgi:uroporphyrinogen-III synthase